jgi:FKBP-type peptidyl-prolyl cis-trans isomerase
MKSLWTIFLFKSFTFRTMKTRALLLTLALLLTSCATKPDADTSNTTDPMTDSTQNTSDELLIEDEVVGTGDEAKAGDTVEVNYVGTLEDGTQFDSSYKRNQTFKFELGAGEVIEGWDQGVAGMKEGGKRKLTIPASMAYGAAGIPGVIPGGATLIFEVELVEVD